LASVTDARHFEAGFERATTGGISPSQAIGAEQLDAHHVTFVSVSSGSDPKRNRSCFEETDVYTEVALRDRRDLRKIVSVLDARVLYIALLADLNAKSIE
jgi:hypothetical protein